MYACAIRMEGVCICVVCVCVLCEESVWECARYVCVWCVWDVSVERSVYEELRHRETNQLAQIHMQSQDLNSDSLLLLITI